jgi:uncharacterized membrane protein YgcG
VHDARRKVRRLRIALAAFAVATLVISGVLGGIATALSWDGLLTPGPAWDDRYTITSMSATGALTDDGRLEVVEDIEVVWHEPRRGLVREIDRSGPAGELRVDDIDVTSDTQDDVWFDVRVDDQPGTTAIDLGEEVEYRPLGTDRYRITYTLDGLLVDVDGDATLRWDTFGDQWTTQIEDAEVTLDLPAGDHTLACVVGARGQAFACDGTGPTWQASELRPGRGMTVEARLEPGTVDAAALPDADLDELTTFSDLALRRLAIVVALSVAAALPLLGTIGGASTRRRRGRAQERIETTGATYVPPRGMRPVTGAMLVHGEAGAADDGQLFAAWLLDAQQRGLIEVEDHDEGFRARAGRDGEADSDAEAETLRALTSGSDGWTTWDAKTSQKRAQRMQETWTKLKSHHTEDAGVPTSSAARVGAAGLSLTAVVLLLAVAVAFVAPVASVMLVVGLFACWATSTITDRWLRTAVADLDGRHLEAWRQLEGLRRFVGEAHAEQISGLADDPNVPLTSPFLELLPWVVGFGHGERWAERFPRQIAAATGAVGIYAPMRATQIAQVRSAAQPASSSSGAGGGASGVGSGGGGGGGGSR